MDTDILCKLEASDPSTRDNDWGSRPTTKRKFSARALHFFIWRIGTLRQRSFELH